MPLTALRRPSEPTPVRSARYRSSMISRIALSIVLVMSLAVPAVAQESTGLSVCGEVKAFTAATATTDGSVTIGSRTFVLKADELYSRVGQNAENLQVGRQICLNGSVNAAQEFTQYGAIRMRSSYCGTVLSFTAPTATTAGSISIRDLGVAQFTIPSGTDVGTVTVGSRACFLLGLDAAGNAVVTGRELTLRDRAVANVHFCGRVTSWTEPASRPGTSPRHETAGSITISTRVFLIAAGTEYPLVNRLPIVGEPTCLSGWLDASGSLISYGAQPGIPPCLGGTIERVRPATDTEDGELRFAPPGDLPSTSFSYVFRIPAGTDLPEDAAGGRYCFELGLDANDLAVVLGAHVPAPPGLGGAGPGVGQLPSTSTR